LGKWNLWNEFDNVRKFNTLPVNEQNRIIGLLSDKNNMQDYYADTLIDLLKDKVSNETFLKMTFTFLLNGRPSYVRAGSIPNIVLAAGRIDQEKTKKVLMKSSSKNIPKLLLIFKNLSVEEEEFGLRALANSKYIPNEIHESKYEPTLKGLSRLPPVMRLKALETLTNNRNLKYNIFKNISEDEFRALVFTSSLKHTERVQEICNKFSELKNMGIESTVEVAGNCIYCGDYKVQINSKIIRTLTGARNTNLGKNLTHATCPFCYTTLKQEPIFRTIK
jgi:hypothetical protein